MKSELIIFTIVVNFVLSRNNGLVLTPPMGWMSWVQYRCETDCTKHPHTCINEDLYKRAADELVNQGYAAVGYKIVHIDDCWMANNRDCYGQLTSNVTRFPNGIQALANYIHSKDLKLGIYENLGTKTCAGYPGTSIENIKTDAQLFANYKSDFLKFDGCFTNSSALNTGYMKMGAELNKTGRPIIYSCSWPMYESMLKQKPPYKRARKHCNVWRIYNDVENSWSSILDIMNFVNKNQKELIAVNGPGGWNDPDQLVIGSSQGLDMLSSNQAKVQMSLWCIWAAPLIMSNSIPNGPLPDEFASILKNAEAISINQDRLGIMGKLILDKENYKLYLKPILPKRENRYSYAIALINTDSLFSVSVNFTALKLGLDNANGYKLINIWQREEKLIKPDTPIVESLSPTSALLLKLIIQ